MRHATFYRVAALLPLLVPVLLAIPSLVTGRGLLSASSGLGMTRVVLVGSLLVAALPYTIFAAVALGFLNRRSQRAYSAAAWTAPLLFALWLAICWLVFAIARSGEAQTSGLLRVALSLGGMALLVGYGYVVIVEALHMMLARLGLVQR
jgi:hypothetical protein